MQMRLNHQSKPLEKIKLFICKRGKIIKYIPGRTLPSASTFTIKQNNKTYSSLVFLLRIRRKQLIVKLFTSLCRKKKILCCEKLGNIFSGQHQAMITEWIRMKITVDTISSLCVQFSHVQVENRSQIINSHSSFA